MLNTDSVTTSLRPEGRALFQKLPEMLRIVVTEAFEVRPAQHDAINHAGVSEFICKYVIAAAGKSGYGPGIGKESAAEAMSSGYPFKAAIACSSS